MTSYNSSSDLAQSRVVVALELAIALHSLCNNKRKSRSASLSKSIFGVSSRHRIHSRQRFHLALKVFHQFHVALGIRCSLEYGRLLRAAVLEHAHPGVQLHRGEVALLRDRQARQ